MKHGRLIDADALKEYFFRPYSNEESYSNIDIDRIIDDQPTVNLSARTEIIVCADCKHWICHDRRCGYWNHGVKPLEWCCHAERREK